MGQYCVSSFVCSCSGAGEGSGFPDAEAKVGCAGGISASLFEGYHRASGLSRERKLESIHKESMVLYVKEPGKRLRFSLTAGLAECHGWSAEPAHIADDAPRRRAQALRVGGARTHTLRVPQIAGCKPYAATTEMPGACRAWTLRAGQAHGRKRSRVPSCARMEAAAQHFAYRLSYRLAGDA